MSGKITCLFWNFLFYQQRFKERDRLVLILLSSRAVFVLTSLSRLDLDFNDLLFQGTQDTI